LSCTQSVEARPQNGAVILNGVFMLNKNRSVGLFATKFFSKQLISQQRVDVHFPCHALVENDQKKVD